MNITTIEKRLLKYIPKAAVQYVSWLDHESYGRTNSYFLTYEDEDGREFSAETSDSVSELRWNAKQAWKAFQEGYRD
jgi:hypothetical protein